MGFKCPKCRGSTEVVWVSKDGKTKGYRCKRGHSVRGHKEYSVYLVEE